MLKGLDTQEVQQARVAEDKGSEAKQQGQEALRLKVGYAF